MSARDLPDVPAQPEYSTDATGVQKRNSDLADPAEWTPWAGPKERPPLPGHEHQLDPGSKVWPWLTERRAELVFFALAGIALALRVGDLALRSGASS
ncbi:MAG TPA: hypothetical protein VIG97_14490 [Luteimonas sp.]